MTSEVIYRPPHRHVCMTTPSGALIQGDPVGTVRRCDCGKAYVAIRGSLHWRRETWWERRQRTKATR